MALFRYRLASILRLRENEHQTRCQELAAAQQEEERIDAQIAALNEALATLQSRVQQDSRPGPIDIDRLRHAQRYEQQLTAELAIAQAKLTDAAAEVERCRQAVIEADVEVRILEKHRAGQLVRHRVEQHKQEIKQLDERALQTVQRDF